jgi:membrane-bound serine protease (ClpP class)
MLSSSIPVVVYVSPEGASAGSAGVFITMAAHVAVMAPATNIGAAHPVQMGGQPMDTVMKQKLVNYAESYIESIAEKRNRNVEWAKSAVRESSSITENEAVKKNVVDFIAANRDELLEKLDGREVNGQTLRTQNATITTLKRTYGEQFLGFLFRPEVMMILMLVAIYGLLGEMSNPGAMFPGIAGAIALILFLYTVSAVPINVAGFALIGLAILLFVSEAFTPTFGLLTIGGAISFFLGGLMLFEDLGPVFQLSWTFLISITLITAGFFAFIVSAGLKAQFIETKVGSETMLGQQGRVLERIDRDHGRIFIDGEYWKARSSEDVIEVDERCEVVDRKGLTLYVKKLTD